MVVSRFKANPSLGAVITEGFFARLGFGIITFTLPFYALSLGMTYTEVGILTALRLVAAIVFKPFMGRIAEHIGKKRIYVISIFGRALVSLLFAFASQPWMLFALRFLHGVTTAARDPASAVLIAEHGSEKKLASSFSWYNAAKEAGAAIGYLVAGFLLTYSHDNYSFVFLFSVTPSVIAMFAVMRWVKEPPRLPETETNVEESGNKLMLFEFAILGLLMATTASMLNNLFPIIATEYAHLTKAEASVIFTASTVLIVLLNPFFGWLADAFSRTFVLSIRATVNAIASVCYALFPFFAGFLIGRMLDDSGKAAFRPAWGAFIADLSGKKGSHGRVKKIAYLDTAQTTGEALGPLIAGLLWDHLNVMWLFGVRIAISILAEVYLLWLLRKQSIKTKT